jgi:hypothetical protein
MCNRPNPPQLAAASAAVAIAGRKAFTRHQLSAVNNERHIVARATSDRRAAFRIRSIRSNALPESKRISASLLLAPFPAKQRQTPRPLMQVQFPIGISGFQLYCGERDHTGQVVESA